MNSNEACKGQNPQADLGLLRSRLVFLLLELLLVKLPAVLCTELVLAVTFFVLLLSCGQMVIIQFTCVQCSWAQLI